jgi:signal transduction histidine kinase
MSSVSIQQTRISLPARVTLLRFLALYLPAFTCIFAALLVFSSFMQIRHIKFEAEQNLREETALLAQSLLNSLNSQKAKTAEAHLKAAIDSTLPGDRSFKNTQIAIIEKDKVIAEMGELLNLQIKQSLPPAHAYLHSDDIMVGQIYGKYAAFAFLHMQDGKTLLVARDASKATYLGSPLIKHQAISLITILAVFFAFAYAFMKQAQSKPVQKTITHSKADKALKEALDMLPNGLCLWDADDTLILSNKAFAALHYAKPEDFRPGMPRYEALTRLIGPRQTLTTPISDDENQVDIQQMHDGRWVQINTQRTLEGGLVSIVSDITDLKNHEFELTAKKNELLTRVYDLDRARSGLETQKSELVELSNRLTFEKARAETANHAKTQFIANMSHDLRTPLNHIMGFAEMMSLRVYGDLNNEIYAEYPEIIHSSGKQLLSLVNDILDVSKIEKGKMEIVKIQTSLSEILEETMPAILTAAEKKNQNLLLDVEPDVELFVDPRALRLTLQNLLSNAVKFTPDFGEIKFIVKKVDSMLKLIVKDKGEGIAPEVLEKLCNPFVQGENAYVRSYQGSGLGLFIAKSLTQLHGGELKMSSVLGEGTTIVIELPLKA